MLIRNILELFVYFLTSKISKRIKINSNIKKAHHPERFKIGTKHPKNGMYYEPKFIAEEYLY